MNFLLYLEEENGNFLFKSTKPRSISLRIHFFWWPRKGGGVNTDVLFWLTNFFKQALSQRRVINNYCEEDRSKITIPIKWIHNSLDI